MKKILFIGFIKGKKIGINTFTYTRLEPSAAWVAGAM